MSQENVEIIRKLFAAYARGEVADSLFDPGLVWNPAEETAMAGLEEARASKERWEDGWETLQTEPEEFIDAGDRVLVTVHFAGRGRESGIDVEARLYEVYTLRGGKITRMDEFTDRPEALEAVGLRE